jgi:hypothetical protein
MALNTIIHSPQYFPIKQQEQYILILFSQIIPIENLSLKGLFYVLTWHATFALKTIEGSK